MIRLKALCEGRSPKCRLEKQEEKAVNVHYWKRPGGCPATRLPLVISQQAPHDGAVAQGGNMSQGLQSMFAPQSAR